MTGSVEENMQNYDAVFKDSFTLFRNKSLRFLGIESDARIIEILSTEKREVRPVDTEFSDLTFLCCQDGADPQKKGFGLHIEEETDIDRKDLYRFCGYHVDLALRHGRDFQTVILTFKKPTVRAIVTPTLTFKPVIIDLSQRNADEVYAALRQQIESGQEINELDLVFLPVCGSKTETVVGLLEKGVELAKRLPAASKIVGLMFMLSDRLVDKNELKRIWREFMDYTKLKVFQVAEEVGIEKGVEIGMGRGIEKGVEKTAEKALRKGYSLEEIQDLTGLSLERIQELKSATTTSTSGL
ncbi:RpnC/YadD family protein [Breznakiellaceae bacterium SP9]